MHIYLAGAMDKVSPEFAVGWRQDAKSLLQKHSFTVLDPTDDKDLWKKGVKATYTKETATEQIIIPDLSKIHQADIILAEISLPDTAYHGTSMELVYATLWEKHVYVWGDCGSPWVIHHSNKIFTYMEDAVKYIIDKHGREC